MSTAVEILAARELERYRVEIGPSEAVDRFIRSYSKVRVRKTYAFHLMLYFRWLREKGVPLTPDARVGKIFVTSAKGRRVLAKIRGMEAPSQ